MSFTGGVTLPNTSVRGVSEAILKNMSFEKARSYGREGITYFNDFLEGTDGLATYAGTGCTVASLASTLGGVLRISMDGTANDEASWAPGDTSVAPYAFNLTSDLGKVCFETRIRKSLVSNNSLAFITGLGKAGLAADNTLTDSTGALQDVDFVGFQVLNAAGGTVNFIHRKTGGSVTTPISGVATMTASTWIKLGFVYDPTADAGKRIRVYVNGAEYTADAVTKAEVEAAAFPSAVAMNPITACIVGSGAAAATLDTDWLFVHQSI